MLSTRRTFPAAQVFSATIAFATSLFWGGNSVVQDALLDYLRTDTTLAFIRTLANKVRQSLVRFRDWKSELAFVTSKVPEVSSRVHQDMLQAKTDVIEIKGVLRFLQLLCEVCGLLCAALLCPLSAGPGLGLGTAGAWADARKAPSSIPVVLNLRPWPTRRPGGSRCGRGTCHRAAHRAGRRCL